MAVLFCLGLNANFSMRNIKSTTLQIISLIGVFLLAQVVFGFAEPVQAPPNGNAPAPLNVGSSIQSKTGGLILNTGGAAYGLIVQLGNMGIGVANPTAKLEVAGQVKITGGSPGSGKILTSDSAGLASWQAPPIVGVTRHILTGTECPWGTGARTNYYIEVRGGIVINGYTIIVSDTCPGFNPSPGDPGG